jgi:hypothetical protein
VVRNSSLGGFPVEVTRWSVVTPAKGGAAIVAALRQLPFDVLKGHGKQCVHFLQLISASALGDVTAKFDDFVSDVLHVPHSL